MKARQWNDVIKYMEILGFNLVKNKDIENHSYFERVGEANAYYPNLAKIERVTWDKNDYIAVMNGSKGCVFSENAYSEEWWELLHRALYKATEEFYTYFHLIRKLQSTFIAKNEDYGDSFAKTYKEFGAVSALVRMTDKLNRAKKLLTTQNNAVGESVQDTLLDLANYAVMTAAAQFNDMRTPREDACCVYGNDDCAEVNK